MPSLQRITRSAAGGGMLFALLTTLALVSGELSICLAFPCKRRQRPSFARLTCGQRKGEGGLEVEGNEKAPNHLQGRAGAPCANGITVSLLLYIIPMSHDN